MQYNDALFEENVMDDDNRIQRSEIAMRDERVRNNSVRNESVKNDMVKNGRVRKITMEDLENVMADLNNELNMSYESNDFANLGEEFKEDE